MSKVSAGAQAPATARHVWRASSSGSITADGRSILCMRPRANASARARRIAPTSSGSRSRSPRPCIVRRAQFIAHAKALPGNPYDGHTLATVIPEMEAQLGANLTRIVADRG
jgi:hypothetical protein